MMRKVNSKAVSSALLLLGSSAICASSAVANEEGEQEPRQLQFQLPEMPDIPIPELPELPELPQLPSFDFDFDSLLSFFDLSNLDIDFDPVSAALSCPGAFGSLSNCVVTDCPDFLDACPVSTIPLMLQNGGLECDNMGEAICASFGQEGCCLRPCADVMSNIIFCLSGGNREVCNPLNCATPNFETIAPTPGPVDDAAARAACHQQNFTSCDACTSATTSGFCYWCPGDAQCHYWPDNEVTSDYAMTASCPVRSDWQGVCPVTSFPFDDPLFSAQKWVFDALNVQPVWDQGFKGEGILVRVNDPTGVDATHPELSARFDAAASCPPYLPQTVAANPDSNLHHGTEVASIAVGAGDNSNCAVGVAPMATLSACAGTPEDALTEQIWEMGSNTSHVSINAWNSNPCQGIDGECNNMNSLMAISGGENAIARGIQEGRGGKGIIYVFPSGDDESPDPTRDASMPGWLKNSRYTISVGAVGKGEGGHASYSTGGPALFVSGPGSDVDHETGHIAATRAGGCGNAGHGTALATSAVGGAIALVLEANPELTWRDLQAILAKTSRQVDASDPSWTTNAAGYVHSNLFGFGVMDTLAAVNLAKTWTNLGPEQKLEGISTDRNQAIPDAVAKDFSCDGVTCPQDEICNDGSCFNPFCFEDLDCPVGFVCDIIGKNRRQLQQAPEEMPGEGGNTEEGPPTEAHQGSCKKAEGEITFTSTARILGEPGFVVESVVVSLDLSHSSPGDLEVILASPWGTQSVLQSPHMSENQRFDQVLSWQLLTLRNHGELAEGTWTLFVTDKSPGDVATCINISFRNDSDKDISGESCLQVQEEQFCRDGKVLDQIVFQSLDANGLSLAEACCACGGGVAPSDVIVHNRLYSWKLDVFGHVDTSTITEPPTQSPVAVPEGLTLALGETSDPFTMAAEEDKLFIIPVAGRTGMLTCRVNVNDSDIDLYLAVGSDQSSQATFACESAKATTEEGCSAPVTDGIEEVYALLYSYSAAADITLACELDDAEGEPPATTTSLDLGLFSPPLDVAEDEERVFVIPVTGESGSLTCSVNADTGDVDMYVGMDRTPNKDNHDCSDIKVGPAETCTVSLNGNKEVRVWLFGFEDTTGVTVGCEMGDQSSAISKKTGSTKPATPQSPATVSASEKGSLADETSFGAVVGSGTDGKALLVALVVLLTNMGMATAWVLSG